MQWRLRLLPKFPLPKSTDSVGKDRQEKRLNRCYEFLLFPPHSETLLRKVLQNCAIQREAVQKSLCQLL